MYGTIQHTHSTWRIPNERWLPYCKGASIESAYCSPCLPKHMLRCKAMLKIYSDIRLNTGFLQIVKFISYWRNSIFITELKVISICSSQYVQGIWIKRNLLPTRLWWRYIAIVHKEEDKKVIYLTYNCPE